MKKPQVLWMRGHDAMLKRYWSVPTVTLAELAKRIGVTIEEVSRRGRELKLGRRMSASAVQHDQFVQNVFNSMPEIRQQFDDGVPLWKIGANIGLSRHRLTRWIKSQSWPTTARTISLASRGIGPHKPNKPVGSTMERLDPLGPDLDAANRCHLKLLQVSHPRGYESWVPKTRRFVRFVGKTQENRSLTGNAGDMCAR